MHVALNAMQVRAAKSGVGQYIEGLVDGFLEAEAHGAEPSHQELTVYCTRQNEGNYRRDDRPNYRTRVWGVSEGRRSVRLLREILFLSTEVHRQGYDLFHGPSNFLPFGLRIPAVATIHDLSYYVEPERCPFFRRQYWYAMTRHTVKSARLLIADSENTRRDLERFFPGSRGRIRVVPLGIHRRFQPKVHESLPDHLTNSVGIRSPEGGAYPFVLSVCTLEPGKNLGILIRAFEATARSFPDTRLILVGDRGWKFEPLLDQIQRSRFRDRILVPGHLPDEDIVSLMQHCRAFVYPSKYEGFGLPPLEALACGAPVLASTGGSLREVLAELPGVVQLDPLDQTGWNRALQDRLDDSPPNEDTARVWSNTVRQRYRWGHTAMQTARVWEEALG